MELKTKYEIKNIKNYPENGKHQECITNLPFDITKGLDSFIYYKHQSDKDYKEYNSEKRCGDKVDNRWIATLNSSANESLKECFSVKLHKDLDKVLVWCERCYILSLEMEIKRLKKEYGTYC